MLKSVPSFALEAFILNNHFIELVNDLYIFVSLFILVNTALHAKHYLCIIRKINVISLESFSFILCVGFFLDHDAKIVPSCALEAFILSNHFIKLVNDLYIVVLF